MKTEKFSRILLLLLHPFNLFGRLIKSINPFCQVRNHQNETCVRRMLHFRGRPNATTRRIESNKKRHITFLGSLGVSVGFFSSVHSFLASLFLAHHVYTLSNTLLTFVVVPVGCIYNTQTTFKRKQRKKERKEAKKIY